MVDDSIIEEETKTTKNKLIKKEKKNKKIYKEISQQILKEMFRSLLNAVVITLYFFILNLAYSAMKEERLVNDIKIFSGVFLVLGIYFLEKAYKKDSGIDALSGIEFSILSLHSLSIMHIITLFKYDFRLYLLASSYIFSSYFVLKAIILYTKGRREYLRKLSDIPEIVKKDEPVKKEARKRNIEETEKRATHKKEGTNITVKRNKKKTTASKTNTTKRATTAKVAKKETTEKAEKVAKKEKIEKTTKVTKKEKTEKTEKEPNKSTSKTTKTKKQTKKKDN